MSKQVERTGVYEITVKLEPFDAVVVAHALEQTARQWNAPDSYDKAKQWAKGLFQLASDLRVTAATVA